MFLLGIDGPGRGGELDSDNLFDRQNFENGFRTSARIGGAGAMFVF
jgi:hypothetical protein